MREEASRKAPSIHSWVEALRARVGNAGSRRQHLFATALSAFLSLQGPADQIGPRHARSRLQVCYLPPTLLKQKSPAATGAFAKVMLKPLADARLTFPHRYFPVSDKVRIL
jgi:hypothetical protein